GRGGSGEGGWIRAILPRPLLPSTPDDVRILIGDLKRVDFPGFNGVPHLVVPVMHDSPQILNALYWTTSEMDRRYRLFARANARNIASYNEKHQGQDRVPYVVFIIDELADLVLQAPIQVEKQITRVAQLARATGIHLVLATQRPSVDVITGLIKANVPARIAFATASSVDSRTIIDMTGAEKLLGRGDMLWLAPDAAKPVRAQGAFVSDAEIEQVIRHWRQQREAHYDLSIVEDKERARVRDDGGDEIDDDRYEEYLDLETDELVALFQQERGGAPPEPTPKRTFKPYRPVVHQSLIFRPVVFVPVLIIAFVGLFLGYMYYQFTTFATLPKLEITDPSTDGLAASSELVVHGITVPGARVTVTLIPGPDFLDIRSGDDGAFDAKVVLSPGSNHVLVEVQAAGKTNKVIRTVLYQPTTTAIGPAPQLVVDQPS